MDEHNYFTPSKKRLKNEIESLYVEKETLMKRVLPTKWWQIEISHELADADFVSGYMGKEITRERQVLSTIIPKHQHIAGGHVLSGNIISDPIDKNALFLVFHIHSPLL